MTESEASLLRRLSEIGVNVDGIWDLVNAKYSYPLAIPVLVEFLEDRDLDEWTLEGVVRSLTVREAKGVANAALFRLFHRTPKENVLFLWAIGNTLGALTVKDDLATILNIVNDQSYGVSRQMFVYALWKFGKGEVEETLIKLLSDDDVVLHA